MSEPCLVLVGAEVGAAALRACFAVDVRVDVLLQIGRRDEIVDLTGA